VVRQDRRQHVEPAIAGEPPEPIHGGRLKRGERRGVKRDPSAAASAEVRDEVLTRKARDESGRAIAEGPGLAPSTAHRLLQRSGVLRTQSK
jgi:hypothetical protein